MSSVSRKEENRILTPEIFEVQSIIQRGTSGNQIFYLVKWKGYSEEQATWEPECNLTGCKQAILQFENIIKMMKSDDNQLQSSAEPTKKIKSKLTKNQIISSISQSKQPTKPNAHARKSQNKNPQKSSRAVKNKQKNKDFSRENEKQIIMEILTKGQSHHNSKEQSSQESGNNILEATTAQTIPTNKQMHLPLIIDKISSKSSEINLIDGISSQLLNKNVNQKNTNIIKVQNSSINQKVKKANLKRSREESEIPEKQTCKPKRKNKKSPLEEVPKEVQKQEKIIKLLPNQNEINHVLEQNKTNAFFNQILSISKCEGKSQKQKPNQKPNQTKSISIMAEYEHEPRSQRYILCEDEFVDLTTEFVGSFDSRLKNNSKISDDEDDRVHTKRLKQRFVDLSSVQFSHLNEKVLKILLSRKEVQKMDQEGEFLFCKIQAMIKINQQIDGKILKQWVCVMKDAQEDRKEPKDIRLFVRIDDLKRDLWKKHFRRFTMGNFV